MAKQKNTSSLKRWVKRIGFTLLILFILLNISAAFHGYKFTHFNPNKENKAKIEVLSFTDKLNMLFFGVNTQRPQNQHFPSQNFETILIPAEDVAIEAWIIKKDSAKGTIILCHGYAGKKESMLPRGNEFLSMGYNVVLIDFRGSGGSSGSSTTIGYTESAEVKAVYEYVKQNIGGDVYLQGTSMGAVAIIKAMHDFHLQPTGIIVECPFESLLQTSKNRFSSMGLPTFPAAHLLVFWGGIQTGFDGFKFKPYVYASSINVPTLLVYGEKDPRVKRFEIDHIFNAITGDKSLLLLPASGHANYLETEFDKWKNGIQNFLNGPIQKANNSN